MTPTEYEEWFQETAAQDCGEVEELQVKDLQGQVISFTPTTSPNICSKMDEGIDGANVRLVTFIGTDGESNPWEAIDELQGSEIVRISNTGGVPKNIVRPINN